VLLKNIYPLDKQRLISKLGYNPTKLLFIIYYYIPAGLLLKAANLKTAKTIIIRPLGSNFSSLAIKITLTISYNVIALGYSMSKLVKI
jgi:hypothetical protein